MFAAHDSVFLGVILTPYYKHQLKTDINFIHVEDGGEIEFLTITVVFSNFFQYLFALLNSSPGSTQKALLVL